MTTPEDASQAAALRHKMITQHMAGRDIMDPKVLNVLEKLPRHRFAQFASVETAYGDAAHEIGCGQTISQPYMVALMTQELELSSQHKVLEIGTGSGYQTAVLAELCRTVYTLERHERLSRQAQQILKQLGYDDKHIHFAVKDGSKGWPEAAPFDRIMVTAASTSTPKILLQQLQPDGGIIIFPMGPDPDHQKLYKVIRSGVDQYVQHDLGPVRFVPLIADA